MIASEPKKYVEDGYVDGGYVLDPSDDATEGRLAIDSSRWTGIEQRIASDPGLIDEISNKIAEIDALVEKSGLTNAERQKAKAITEALRSLVASPEPEWEAIVTLLNSPNLTAVLNVAAIIQIVFALMFGK